MISKKGFGSETTNPAEAGFVHLPLMPPFGYFFSSAISFVLSAATVAFSPLIAWRSL